MKTNGLPYLLFLFLAAAIAACGDSNAPEGSVDGAWAGLVGSQRLMIQLAENSGVVTGSGTLDGVGANYALTVSGSWTARSLSVTLTSGQHPPFNLTATLNDDVLQGRLNGSGFQNAAITLTQDQVILPPEDPKVRSVVVSPSSGTVVRGGVFQFGAAVDADPPVSRTVTWTATGGTGISVDQTGLATASATATGVASICAASTVTPTVKGCAQLAVTN